ncbi:MAG: RNA-binding S4 domain-containing protein [Flavobacteriales bacterium]
MKIRFDKYVWCVRLAKTRSQASELISKGKITLNGQDVKSSKEVKETDLIGVQKNNALFQYKVLQLLDKRLGAALISNYIEDQTSEEELIKFKQYQLAQRAYRETDGKPTKKDRRELDRFMDDWQD